MRTKWFVLIVFVALYIVGMIGVGWHTYDVSRAVPNSSPIVEMTKIFFIMLGGLGVILPTYLNVWQSVETATVLEEQMRRNIIENTVSILDRWDDKALVEARKFTREIKDRAHDLSPNDLLKQIRERPDLRQSIIVVFNYFDSVRISIEKRRVDSDLVAAQLGFVFHDMYRRFSPWIETTPPRYQVDLKKLVALLPTE